jgi:transcriptional regulator with XRE-family HTH domain
MNVTDLGKEVAKRRRELELSQDQLAEKAGISRTYISLIERGDAQNVTRSVLEKLANVFGTSTAVLLGQPEQKELLIPPALKDFAIKEQLTVDIVERLVRLPRRGREPHTLEEWKVLYDAVKEWLQ